jgi:hypothetical protein
LRGYQPLAMTVNPIKTTATRSPNDISHQSRRRFARHVGQ